MKKAQMNISHFRFILLNLKIFGEILATRVGLNFEFESAHELLMNLNLNSKKKKNEWIQPWFATKIKSTNCKKFNRSKTPTSVKK